MNNLNATTIQLNGASHKIKTGDSLEKLLNNLKIQKNKVAIEVNGKIIEKRGYESLVLNNNDKVEIVHFIGGG